MLNKKLILIITSFLFFHKNVLAQSFEKKEEQQFIENIQHNINSITNNYNNNTQKPLQAKIFDINNNEEFEFLNNTFAKLNYRENFLSTIFYPNFLVDNKATSFCFIAYNSLKYNEVSNYLTFFKNKDNARDLISIYLSVHELGHCFEANQKLNSSKEDINSLYTHPYLIERKITQYIEFHPKQKYYKEVLADIFASLFLIKINQKESLITFANITSKTNDDFHNTSNEIMIIYNHYHVENLTTLNTEQIFNLAIKERLKIIH